MNATGGHIKENITDSDNYVFLMYISQFSQLYKTAIICVCVCVVLCMYECMCDMKVEANLSRKENKLLGVGRGRKEKVYDKSTRYT